MNTGDLQIIREALTNAEQSCRYHGQNWRGWAYGEPRCDSCKQPYRVTRALEAVDRLLQMPRPPAETVQDGSAGVGGCLGTPEAGTGDLSGLTLGGLPAVSTGNCIWRPDFYEDDEPAEKVQAAFEAGQKGVTAPPPGAPDAA